MADTIPEQVEQAVDQALVDTGALRSAAEQVVADNNITKFDFFEFRSALTDMGFSEDAVTETWDRMRDDDAIPEGDESDHPRSNDEESEEETEDGSVEFSGEGIPAQFPPWAMEPWDVAIQPMGAGELFANQPCDGENNILWHMGDPDEAETLADSGEVTGANTRSGGMFDTEWAERPDGTAFNAMVNDSLDGGVLVGLRACMVDGEPEGEQWDQVNDNRWSRDGGYSTKQTVAFQISKAHSVPDDAPMVRDVIDEDEILSTAGVGSASENEPPGGLSGEWEIGDDILITQPGCPACQQAKNRDSISEALESGELIEVTPEHEDWDVILEQTGLEHTPGLATLTNDGFRAADFPAPAQPAGKV